VGSYWGSKGAKRLVCPIQSIGLQKLHAETLSPSGHSVEERHLVERKRFDEGAPFVGL
jgi:hypothetical protein